MTITVSESNQHGMIILNLKDSMITGAKIFLGSAENHGR